MGIPPSTLQFSSVVRKIDELLATRGGVRQSALFACQHRGRLGSGIERCHRLQHPLDIRLRGGVLDRTGRGSGARARGAIA
jgi:hypothetical protein